MTRAGEFERLRPLLFSIAYRILGTVSEAEDAVQETWLRYAASPTQPTSTKAFLSAVVTRVSIDVLRSARSGGKSTSGHGFLSRWSTTLTRILNARRSWPIRYRWRPCCCSSG